MRKGFKVRLRVILREGFRTTPYRGKKEKKRLDDVICLQKQGRRFRTMPYRGKKKRGWTTSFKG